MGSELDLDDAIASILADSDEDDKPSKKKRTSLSKKKLDDQKHGKRLNSKALTSSVSEEDFYKNLSKIAEESNKDEDADDVLLTEDDAKKMASDLAGLDDLDSDLLGTLGKKNKSVSSPRIKQTKDHDADNSKDPKRKTSSGSLHRRGSVTPFNDEGDGDVVDNHWLSDDDSEEALNASMNSTRSRHRKTGGSKKSPNKISPRVGFDDIETDTKSKKTDQSKGSKSKEINFDSDSDLPGLDNHEVEQTTKESKKSSARSRKAKRKTEKDAGDLFGDDDDLPDLDGPPQGKVQQSETPSKKAASVLDDLMGRKSNSSAQESTKKAPASMDEFMAKVSTTSKPLAKSEIQSPLRSPTTEESFLFGGYKPSAAAGSGRRSRNSRPESASEFGRRSVKFPDDLGLDDDTLGAKKRPSTAPGGRKKRDEHGDNDPLSSTFSGQSSKDKSDWLGLDETGQENNSKKERKVNDLSPQASLQVSSKSSASGDWLGLGDDVTDEQLNASPMSSMELKREKSPERTPRTSPRQKPLVKKDDDELSKMLDLVPDLNSNAVANEDESLFPWEGGKSSGRRRRPDTAAPSLKIQTQEEVVQSELGTETRQGQDTQTSRTSHEAGALSQRTTAQTGILDSHVNLSSPSEHSPPKPAASQDPVLGSGAHHTTQTKPDGYFANPHHSQDGKSDMVANRFVSERDQAYNEVEYRSELDKQRNVRDVELREMTGKLQEMEKEKYQVELELANKVAALETKIRRLEVENESLLQTLELTKQRQKDEISALENSHRMRVQAVEESYQRREARQKEETELLITKHKETVRQLDTERSDLEGASARKISSFESSKLKEIERLSDLHRRALEELRSEHNSEINHLKRMKEQEVSATVTAYSHTKSLQTLMEQVLNSTKQVDDLHHLVEVSHKTSQQERDVTARAKDEYLSQLYDRLLRQQTENEEERTRLHNLVAKMEVHVREQNRKLEEDKWKLNQEESRLKSLRVSLEEERSITREQLEAERVLLQRTKDEFFSQQKRMMIDVNEERKSLSLERAELAAAQRGIISTEKHKQENFTKMDVEQESTRIRLVEDTAALNTKETQLRKEQEELKRERREFLEKREKWQAEKDHIGKLGLELEKRAQDIEEVSLEAARVREEGSKCFETAQRMQLDIAKQANELESKVLLLQEKERQIAADRLATVTEKRELEIEKRHGLCIRCSQSQPTRMDDSNRKWEPSPRQSPAQLLSSDPSPSSTHKSTAEVVPSAPATSQSVLPLTPDLLVNTLEMKRTLRRWSQDREQDEEFLAKESEFLSSLHDTMPPTRSLTRTQYSAVS